jgi:hypothetical protein
VASRAATTGQQEPTFPLPPLSYREATRLNTLGQAANFAATAFAKREMAVNTLRKVKSVNITLSNIRFVPITESKQDVV